jgi:hypothetical protein
MCRCRTNSKEDISKPVKRRDKRFLSEIELQLAEAQAGVKVTVIAWVLYWIQDDAMIHSPNTCAQLPIVLLKLIIYSLHSKV